MEAARLARFKRRIQRAERRNVERYGRLMARSNGNNTSTHDWEDYFTLQSSSNKSIHEVVEFLAKARIKIANMVVERKEKAFWSRLKRRLVRAARRNALRNVRISGRRNSQPNTNENNPCLQEVPQNNNSHASQVPNTISSSTTPINITSHSIVNVDGSVSTTTTICQPPTNIEEREPALRKRNVGGQASETRRVRRRLVQASRQSTNQRLLNQRKFTKAWDFGKPSYTCMHCGAILWYEERTIKSRQTRNPTFSICCSVGQIMLPLLKDTPAFLESLISYGGGQASKHFRKNIRAYNMSFAMTSMGGNIDKAINNGTAPYVFRLGGQNYHKIGSLLPPEGYQPTFAQLYIYDTENEVPNRVSKMRKNVDANIDEHNIISDLLKMLDDCNVLVKSFRMARDRFKEEDVRNVKLRIIGSRKNEIFEYTTPIFTDVAALIVGDFDPQYNSRDIVVDTQAFGLQRIYETHPSFMALQYPLLFPYGEDGFRRGICKRTKGGQTITDKKCTMREYYAYRLQQRSTEGKTLVRGGRLYQQYIVDSYTCIEQDRLHWLRTNQGQLRSELYNGLKDAVWRGDTDHGTCGKRIILPSSFTGSRRYMIQNYQDAMAICRWAGYPDLFITFTCNPKWPEVDAFIQSIPGQKAEDRPDIVARVFKIKLDQLLHDIKKGKHFGTVTAVIYTIEFQKRGLPHAHILIFLHSTDKNPTPEHIDKIISAEIPDRGEDPDGYEAVQKFMVHGPCRAANPRSPCMFNQKCRKHFPKRNCARTTIDETGFPIYRRRENDRVVEKAGIHLDNRFVVPYNIDLLVKYQAHINVEWCNRSRSIKYLFKYVTKGPDRATIAIQQNARGDGRQDTQPSNEQDEIKSYLECRYLSASEACWRIFEFDIHYRQPAVERLNFHLIDEQSVTFRDDENLENVLHRPNIQNTMFTEWMKMNESCEDARRLTYAEFPRGWVWHSDTSKWSKRKAGNCIGRLFNAHPSSGEKFYMRMLLNIVKGPKNHEEIKIVNNECHQTYKAACYALGLLEDDGEWHEAITEASIWATASQLRELFATMLTQCEVSDPLQLWERNWKLLTEDIEHRQRHVLSLEHLKLSEAQRKNYGLHEIDQILIKMGRKLKDYPPLPVPDAEIFKQSTNRLIQEEMSYDVEQLRIEHSTLFAGLNDDQMRIYAAVMNAVNEQAGGLFFIYGHGGTGKTYLYKTILSAIRSQHKIALAVASSGIAALLLPGGRTAHSRFHIPIKLTEESTCEVKPGSHAAELLSKASIIIWDEAPMAHKQCFEAVDRTLKDIMRLEKPENETNPFGGKVVVMGGDFRQILPVVPKGGREDIVQASINRSYLWQHCNIFLLQRNMRLASTSKKSNSTTSQPDFAKWILQIGDGEDGNGDGESEIQLLQDLIIPSTQDPASDIIQSTYPNLEEQLTDKTYLEERAILAPTNEIVEEINNRVIKLIKGDERTYLSADSICKASSYSEDQETLYPIEFLNTLKFPGIPNHKLILKVGLPIMLLRNLNQTAGLCNGTRLIITQLGDRIIEAEIITGINIGTKVFIPRIGLSPSDTKWPFILKRRQFPITVCFAMTINKSQGQSLKNVGLFLPKTVFTHGQLYVAISRVTSRSGLKVLINNDNSEKTTTTKNIVYTEVFNNLPKD